MKNQWIEKNGLETPFAAALYGAPSRYGFYVTREDGMFCFHNFHATYAAKKFVDMLINGHDIRWINKQEIITSHGTRIRGEYHTDLEKVIEYEYRGQEKTFTFPEPYQTMFERFARLARAAPPPPPTIAQAREQRKEKRASAPPQARPDGLTSLAEICAELGIDPRDARQALRKSNTPKPDWGWAWPAKDVPAIERVLKGK